MRKARILMLFAVLLSLLSVCALAETAVVAPQVEVALSQSCFTAPGPVEVTITVTNASGADMPGPCALYDPDGLRITDFGQPTLKAGESAVWAGTWNVTESQLTQGKIVFALAYTFPTDNGALQMKTQPFSLPIIHDAPAAQLEVVRTITPPVARNGQKVYVTYAVTNAGSRRAEDVTITERAAVASTPAQLGQLAPGETVRHTFVFTMGKKDVVSAATITCDSGAGLSSAALKDATIKYGDVKLSAKLTSDRKGGQAGDVIRLTLTLKNTGKKDISGITVTDPVLGTVFSDLRVGCLQTFTLEKEILLTESCDLLFTVTGTNADGSEVITATEMLPLTVIASTEHLLLSLYTQADCETIPTLPAVVRFTVTVSNPGNVVAPDVTVVSNGVRVYPYDPSSKGVTLQPGDSFTFSRDVLVETPGKFRFDANTLNQLGEAVVFEGIPLPIRYEAPSAKPAAYATGAPQVSITLSRSTFLVPAPVLVSIRVTNASDEPMAGPCALYDSQGQRITAFGTPTLPGQETAQWSGVVNVTQDHLEQGFIPFVLMYTVLDDNGSIQVKTSVFRAAIVHAESADHVDVQP